MNRLFFALLAICIAANYAKASDESTTFSHAAAVKETNSHSDSITSAASKDNKGQSKEIESYDKHFDHAHKDHHEHEATVTIDVHNILDLFKQQLKQSEQSIIAALRKDDGSLIPLSKESYRTADRNAKKQNMSKKDEEKETNDNEKEEDDEDD